MRNILDFPHQFSPKASIVTLDQNYRSTVPILDAAQRRHRARRRAVHEEPLVGSEVGRAAAADTRRDDVAQSGYVVPNRFWRIAKQASRSRRRRCSSARRIIAASLEIELTRRNIPFVKFGGLKFLEAAHIKDVLAIMRWAENPRDRVSGFRVAQLMPGIGPAAAGASCWTGSPKARTHQKRWKDLARRGAAAECWPSSCPRSGTCAAVGWLACRARSGMPVVRAAPREPLRRRGGSSGRSRPALSDRRRDTRTASAS